MRGQSKPDEMLFESDHLQLHGFPWEPAGDGTFPVVVWNHGSEKMPGAPPTLAQFYTAHSYVRLIFLTSSAHLAEAITPIVFRLSSASSHRRFYWRLPRSAQ